MGPIGSHAALAFANVGQVAAGAARLGHQLGSQGVRLEELSPALWHPADGDRAQCRYFPKKLGRLAVGVGASGWQERPWL